MSRTYPNRPIAGVAAVVFKDQHILLIKRGNAPRLGEWHLPGGVIEPGEEPEEALIREVKEETGIDIRLGGPVDVVELIEHDASGQAIYHYRVREYWALWVASEPKAGGDADEARWVDIGELKPFGLTRETLKIIEQAEALRD